MKCRCIPSVHRSPAPPAGPGGHRGVRAAALGAVGCLLGVCTARPQTAAELGPAPITNGQYTGRISALVCSPSDPDRYFVAGADGGVWRTTDGGQTWMPLTDPMPTTAMGALALDPADENVIYAGSGEANFAHHSRYGLGLFKSTDGGNSWVQLAASTFAGRCFSRIVIHPFNSQLVYAAVTPAGGFPAQAAAKNHPGANGPVGVFRSADGGTTWSHLSGGLPALAATDLAIDPVDPAVLYAAIGHIFGSPQNGIYKTTDGGNTWTRLGGGLPTDSVGRISVAVAPARPSRLYALITRAADPAGGGASVRAALRSDDGGSTWTSLPLGNIQATYGWYLSLVCVHPTNPDVVFFGGLSLARSTNAGASFSTVTPPHVDMHAAAWDAAGRLVVGDDGGVHRTADLGGFWTAHNSGLGVIQFYAGLSTHPTDEQILFGGTQDNGSNRRSTGSREWTQVFGGDGGWTQLARDIPTRVFVEYQGTGNLFRSADGGNSFQASNAGINAGDRNCFLPPYQIDPLNSARMLYATHRIYRSTNAGLNWTPISGDLTNGAGAIRSLAIAPSDPAFVYAATNDGKVLVSSDGGVTFVTVRTGNPGWPRVTREIFVHPLDPRTVYLAVASFGTSQLLRSRDAGQSWEALDANFPDIPVNTVAVDVRCATPVLYAGADDGLYRSDDDGQSWHRYGHGLPRAAVIDLRLEPDRGRIIVATQGRGAWRVRANIPGDLDGDADVDQSDLGILLAAFGVSGDGDLDSDGDTDQADLGILLARWSTACR